MPKALGKKFTGIPITIRARPIVNDAQHGLLPVDILAELGPCLLVNKPSGVLTQAPPNIDSMELRIKRLLKVRDQKPGKVYLAVVHRLDRPVSGVMVFAKHVRAAKRIAEQFEGRTVEKTYWALVEGQVEESGTWTDWVRKIPGEARSEIVDESHPEGRKAVLHFTRRGQGPDWSLLEIRLETGRTHQIRIQTSHHGVPVRGDRLYGSQMEFGPETSDERKRCIGLHARELSFRHPMTQEMVVQCAPFPDYWFAETDHSIHQFLGNHGRLGGN